MTTATQQTGFRREFDPALAGEAVRLLYDAKPRLFVENFCYVRNREGRLVRMVLTPNQLYYYAETFAKMIPPAPGKNAVDAPLAVTSVKDRQAEHSSFWGIILAAYASQMPFFDVLLGAQQDDTAEHLLHMIDTMLVNLPPELQTKMNHNGDSYKEFRFEEHVSGPGCAEGKHQACRVETRGTSYITIVTPRSAGRVLSRAPKAALLSESGQYDEAHDRKMQTNLGGGMHPGTWWIEDTTPGSKRTGHYKRYRAIDEGLMPGVVLRRYWHMNPKNVLPEGSLDANPLDRYEITLTPFEQRMASQFPQDGIPVEDRIRRWRAWYQRELVNHDMDEDSALAETLQQHATDDVTCWLGGETSSLKMSRRIEMVEYARDPTVKREMVAPGFWLSVWQNRVHGHEYAAIMDPARTGQRDYTACLIFDLTTDMQVAELYGRIQSLEALDYIVPVLHDYYDAMFVPETNIEASVPEIAIRMGHPRHRTYRRKKRKTESDAKARMRPWGFDTVGSNKPDIARACTTAMTQGTVTLLSKGAVEDLSGYDWADKTDHTPDRAICVGIYCYLRGTGELGPTREINDPMTKGRGQVAKKATKSSAGRGYVRPRSY